jgi:hypothetical protein
MLAAGFHTKSRITRANLGPGEANRTLASLGLRAGDVIGLSTGPVEKFFELGAGTTQEARTTTANHGTNS